MFSPQATATAPHLTPPSFRPLPLPHEEVNYTTRRVALIGAAFFLNLISFAFFPLEIALATLAITVISGTLLTGIILLAEQEKKETFSHFCTTETSPCFRFHPPSNVLPPPMLFPLRTTSAPIQTFPLVRQRYVAAPDFSSASSSHVVPSQGHVYRPPASSGTTASMLPIRGLPSAGQAPGFPPPAPASNVVPGQGHVAAPSFSSASSNVIPGQGHIMPK